MCCHFPKKRGGSLEGARVSPLTTYGTTLDRVGRGHPSCQCLSEIDQQEWTIDLSPQANTGLVEKESVSFCVGFCLVKVPKLRAVVLPVWASESPVEMSKPTTDLLNQKHILGIQRGRDTKSISALVRFNH